MPGDDPVAPWGLDRESEYLLLWQAYRRRETAAKGHPTEADFRTQLAKTLGHKHVEPLERMLRVNEMLAQLTGEE